MNIELVQSLAFSKSSYGSCDITVFCVDKFCVGVSNRDGRERQKTALAQLVLCHTSLLIGPIFRLISFGFEP